MLVPEDKLPKLPISAENLVRFYLYLWPEDRTQVEVSKALKIEGAAVRTTAKILRDNGLLIKIFSEKYSPNIVLSVPIKDILLRICNIIGEKNTDEIIDLAMKDRTNFTEINISKIKVVNKESLNWKIANVLYKESVSFLFREILSYGKFAHENKQFARFLNRIGFKTILRQDVMDNIMKKHVLSEQYQNFQLPKFNIVFYKPEEE